MTLAESLFRTLAILTGGVMLAAVAHTNVLAKGGYDSPNAYITLAHAVGVFAGALIIGRAWNPKQPTLAILLGLALFLGEFAGLATTADRVISARDEEQSIVRKHNSAREKAQAEYNAAKTAREAIGSTTPRIEAAAAAVAQVNRDVAAQSSLKTCLKNCADLLKTQLDTANSELTAARAELANKTDTAQKRLETAQAAFKNLQPTRSATPLADNLNLPASYIDLGIAGSLSFGLNGLAACLLAFGAHPPHSAPPKPSTPPLTIEPEPNPRPLRAPVAASAPPRLISPPRTDISEDLPAITSPPRQKARRSNARANARSKQPKSRTSPAKTNPPVAVPHVRDFAIQIIKPDNGHVPLAAFIATYRRWCQAKGIVPLSNDDFADAIVPILAHVGIQAQMIDGTPVIPGIGLAAIDNAA